MAANTPAQGWVILPASNDPVEVFKASGVSKVTRNLSLKNRPFWQNTTHFGEKGKALTWSLAGTLPDAKVFPLAIVVLLEEDNPDLAGRISLYLLQLATRIK
jgi:hypothetical protein